MKFALQFRYWGYPAMTAINLAHFFKTQKSNFMPTHSPLNTLSDFDLTSHVLNVCRIQCLAH